MPILLSEITQYLESHSVTNFAALPAANTVTNELWYCINSQGTKYITALFGGTYYPSGWYFSDGANWTYQTTAFEASQPTVDAGLVTDQFVSPATFNNASKWATKANASGYTTNRVLVSDALGNLTVNAALTTNRIPYVDSNGLLIDSNNLTFNGTVLSLGNPTVLGSSRVFRVGQGTATVDIGSMPTSTNVGAIYLATSATLTDNNYNFAGLGVSTFINAASSGTINFRIAGVNTVAVYRQGSISFTPASTTGITSNFSIVSSVNTNAGSGTESISFDVDMRANMAHGTNVLVATQRDALYRARTHSFGTAGGVITTGATLVVDGAPIAGTNCTITRPLAAWIQSGETLLSGYATGFQIKAVAYTLTASDRTIEVSTAGATQTLPTAVSCAGREYRVINTSLGVVRVDTTSSQTIGNANAGNPTFIDLNPEEWLDVVSNGTNWRII